MNPLVIALVISVGLNLFLGKAYLGQRDTATVAKTETGYVAAAAKECSKGTEALAGKAAANAKKAAPKREAAASEAAQHNAKADEILATPPAAPGDECKSAQARVDTWWEGRK